MQPDGAANNDAERYEKLAHRLDRDSHVVLKRLDWPPAKLLTKTLKKLCTLPFEAIEKGDELILRADIGDIKDHHPWFAVVKGAANVVWNNRPFGPNGFEYPSTADFIRHLRLEPGRRNEISVAACLRELGWTKRRFRVPRSAKQQSWLWFPPGDAPVETAPAEEAETIAPESIP